MHGRDGTNADMKRQSGTTRNGKVYITQREAADALGVCDRTVRRMIAAKRLNAYRLGPRMIRLRLDEVEAALRPIGG